MPLIWVYLLVAAAPGTEANAPSTSIAEKMVTVLDEATGIVAPPIAIAVPEDEVAITGVEPDPIDLNWNSQLPRTGAWARLHAFSAVTPPDVVPPPLAESAEQDEDLTINELAIAPVRTSVYMLDVLLGPVREANMLLPKRWDPIGNEGERKLLPTLTAADDSEEEFSLAKQRQLLGTSLVPRVDTPDTEATWNWQLQLGGSYVQAITSNATLVAAASAERRCNRSVYSGKLEAYYNQVNNESQNNRVFGEVLSDHNLRGHWICYVRETAEYDQQRLLDLRTVTSAGLGFKFIDQVDTRLIARTGPTISYWMYDPAAEEPDQFRSGWMLESEYRRVIFESTRLEWTTTAFPDFDSNQQFRIRNEAAILFPIGGATSAWNWKIGANNEYQVDPVANTKANTVEVFFSITYAK